MEMGARIRELRKRAGISQMKLGSIIDVDANAISRWERDKVEPARSSLIKLANALGTTIDYLIGQADLSEDNGRVQYGHQETSYICGAGFANMNYAVTVKVLPRDIVFESIKTPFWRDKKFRFESVLRLPVQDMPHFSSLIAIYAENESMAPAIRTGDMALFADESSECRKARTGDVVAANYNGRVVIRGLLLRGSAVTLKAKNPEFEDIDITADDDFGILGKVLKIYSFRDAAPLY